MATMRIMPLGNSTLFFLRTLALIGSLLFGMPRSNASDRGLVHIQTPSGITIHPDIADTPLKRASVTTATCFPNGRCLCALVI